MHGTVPQKIGRLVGNLLLHPRYNTRYLSHNLVRTRTPLDLEIPWFSYAAIDFLEGHLRSEMCVFEYGSGGSTVFFARRTSRVTAVENNPEWHQLVSERLRAKKLPNATLRLCPFDFKHPDGFAHSEYLAALDGEKYDVIVVDGSEEWTQVRPICFSRAEEHIKPGGIIVVDDSWRYGSIRRSHKARRHEVFQSVGPCRPGVTSTDIFFY
jgi:precorrin-6B methylase 2